MTSPRKNLNVDEDVYIRLTELKGNKSYSEFLAKMLPPTPSTTIKACLIILDDLLQVMLNSKAIKANKRDIELYVAGIKTATTMMIAKGDMKVMYNSFERFFGELIDDKGENNE